jgi:hypothetical protein
MLSPIQAPGQIPRRVYRGKSLAHKKITRRQLAVTAADIIERNADYVPTQEQLARNLGISVREIQEARNGRARKYRKPSLDEVLQKATVEERTAAVRKLGGLWVYENLVILL